MVQTLERPSAPTVNRPTGIMNFVWHFLEMCAAMCLAWMLVTLPFIAIATSAGTADPVRQWPEIATIVAVLAMSAGMAVDMRWRRHEWRCIGEMTAAMVIEAVALIGLAAAGAFPRSDMFVWFHALMPLAMIAAMLFRRDLYTAPLRNRHQVAAVG